MMRLVAAVLALAVAQDGAAPLTLEIRVFHGTEDVTAQTRLTIHPAGVRSQPVAHIGPGEARLVHKVLPGIYDAQVVREREGRILNIRWAERLVVMPYPDEDGQHLEVINFTPGFGALQIRGASAGSLLLFGSGDRGRGLAPIDAYGYRLFVVPAGQYDIQVGDGPRAAWQNAIDVPLDRTRLWLLR